MAAKKQAQIPEARDVATPMIEDKVGILHVGIDLGTSRSAIASSNGTREVMASLVGWPKDSVSAKVLGRTVVVGDRVHENRLALNCCFPLKDGNLAFTKLKGDQRKVSRRAGVRLLAALRKAARAQRGQAVCAVIGAPAEATRENKEAIIDLAREARIDGVMVVSEPFAVAYALDALENAIVIDIGAGTIDLCRMAGSLPCEEDQVTLFQAGDYVDQRLGELIHEAHPEIQFTSNMIKLAKERFSSMVDTQKRAIVSFPAQGRPTKIDITDQIRTAVTELVPSMIAGIQKLVSTFDPEFQHKIRDKVIVSGGGSQVFGLQDALESGLDELGGGRVTIVDDPVFTGAQGALKLAQDMPLEYWNQIRS
jgi:rod shape-determining protein MreB